MVASLEIVCFSDETDRKDGCSEGTIKSCNADAGSALKAHQVFSRAGVEVDRKGSSGDFLVPSVMEEFVVVVQEEGS